MTTADGAVALALCLVLSPFWAAFVFAGAALMDRRLPAAADRHVLWWLALAATAAPLAALPGLMLAPFAVPAVPAPAFGGVLGTGVLEAVPGAPLVKGLPWTGRLADALRMAAMPLLFVHAAGVAWCLACRARGHARLQRLLSACRPLAEGELRCTVASWSARLGLERVPPVLLTPEPVSPFLAARRGGVLVLPDELVSSCAPRQLALICAHELAHLARRDLACMRLQTVLAALFWFNPAARAMCGRLEASREQACDDLVLAADPGARRDYARAFLQALRRSAGQAAHGIPFIHHHKEDHEMRLANIMKGERARRRHGRVFAAALAAAAIALPLAGGQAALAEAVAGTAPAFSGAVVAGPAGRITSPYGPRIFRGEERHHNGVDIAAPLGTPVVSPGKGRVQIVSGEHRGHGKRIEIDYGGGWHMIFSQLDSYAVAEGETVEAGQQIGTVGASGRNATGPHLHLEVRVNGKPVDPATVLDLTQFRKLKNKTAAAGN